VLDLETHKTDYYKDLGLQGLMHYNACRSRPVPRLSSENLVVVDNQGTALVLAPDASSKSSRASHRTQLDRVWPIPAKRP